jgi:hypothetical protein
MFGIDVSSYMMHKYHKDKELYLVILNYSFFIFQCFQNHYVLSHKINIILLSYVISIPQIQHHSDK